MVSIHINKKKLSKAGKKISAKTGVSINKKQATKAGKTVGAKT